ncbi:outer membrane lipoprotein-sorting protein [Candidatus Sulfidibacterium hydrothermale]|uniref:outer membrane lipoprotein-sorting protein n=1 Tax=Candidatus Sulfidibacterium hydrothermale TaxID=2875962 RepID=UPI001F0A635B|nr:outer membrane lipoprotein-sorting protein [Candidatus Sulfidibacterium hydrothermale]UBM62399.1 outer membrane lipoprotein-sorting protein [Candidatus Sulfidibacterium hydrothermale]
MKATVLKLSLLFLFLGGQLFSFSASAQSLPVKTILQKMDAQAASLKDKTAKVVMEMINNQTGKVKTRKAIIKQKPPYRTLFRFTYPPSQAGIATLSLPGDVVYLYMPAFGKPKKISNIANGGAFSQSDFTTKDMGPKNWAKNYTGKLLKTNDTAYILQLIPKNKSEYSKLIVTVNKKHFFPERIVYYNLQGKIMKEADNQYVKVGNIWVAKVSSMTNYQKMHTTRIINSDIRVNQGLKDSEFTVEKLVPADKRNK